MSKASLVSFQVMRSNPGCDSVKTPEKVFKRLRMADRAALRELAVRAIGEDSLGRSPTPSADS